MSKKRLSQMGGLAAIVALVVAGVAVAALSGAQASGEGVTLPVWPEFKMVYETNGSTIGVGDNPPVTTRETRRLDYVSSAHWTYTVIDAPTFDTKQGPQSRLGAYMQLQGQTVTEGEPQTAGVLETTVDDDTLFLPGGMMAPFPIEASGIDVSLVTTSARVCFLGRCADNAQGLLYRMDNGSEVVFVNDARGIPLRMGHPADPNVFLVSEIRINDERQELSADEESGSE